MATAKHFPGHGRTLKDTHYKRALIQTKPEILLTEDISPFVHAIKHNVAAIMVSHVTYHSLDNLPASISHNVITNILRNSLGFQGLIITDDIMMSAITKSNTIENAIKSAILAGNNIILTTQPLNDFQKTIIKLKQLVSPETVQKKVIDTSNLIASLLNKYNVQRNISNATRSKINDRAIYENVFNESLYSTVSPTVKWPLISQKSTPKLANYNKVIANKSLDPIYLNTGYPNTKKKGT